MYRVFLRWPKSASHSMAISAAAADALCDAAIFSCVLVPYMAMRVRLWSVVSVDALRT